MAPPYLIELDEAVSRIKQACESRSSDALSPFFFMVGAGISCPSVPLAADIVAQCQEVAGSHGRKQEPVGKNALDLYSHWFQTAYGEPDQRQKYLRELIEGRPITHANFRLAHLMLNNTISNIVVTVNFDDFLSKALTLFGKPHIVCDHPQTVGRINPSKQILQIVHLHGTYWFYDCCNLRGELEDRALQSTQTTSTMASLLDMILWDRSPLVLGYSGWEGDVFIEALKRRLARPLGTSVYWFCYKRSTVDLIPDQLRNNPHIRFVVPKEPVSTATVAIGELREGHPESVQETKSKGLSATKDEEPALSADTVINKMIRAFKLEAPELTKDPLGFFAARLDDSLPRGEANDTETDLYAIKGVIERVRMAKKREEAEKVEQEVTRASTKGPESTLEKVRDAVRRADFREAVKESASIQLDNLETKELDELADTMWSAAAQLKDNSEDEVRAYDLVIRVRTKQMHVGAETPAMQRQLAEALYKKGVSLRTTNRSEEALDVFDELTKRYSESRDPALLEFAARGLFDKAYELGTLNRRDEEMVTYDEFLKQYGESTLPVLQEMTVFALFNKAVRFHGSGASDEAFRLYDEILDRYGEEEAFPFRISVAKVLHNKAFKLAELERNEESMALYDEVLRRYEQDQDFEFREQVANSLYNKALIFRKMGQNEEEKKVYQAIVKRYEEATEPVLRKIVASAFNSLGFRELVNAKALLKNDLQAGQKELRRAAENIDAAIERNPEDPVMIGNQAYIAFLLGRHDEARKLLTQAIQLGGERIRTAELQDADINRLPEDDEFCEMVQSIRVRTAPPNPADPSPN